MADDRPSCCDAISDSEDSCVILESTTEGPPTPKKAKATSKFTGAAKYKTKFNPDWKKEFPFITSVASDPYRLYIS